MIGFWKRCVLIIVFFNTLNTHAQQGTKRVFSSVGLSSFADVVILPVDSFTRIDKLTNTSELVYIQPRGLSLLTLIYNANLFLPVTDELALSYTISPSASFLVLEGGGFGAFNIPLTAAINVGAGSSYLSSKKVGFFMGAGLEINYAPITFNLQSQARTNYTWLNTVFTGGLRFKTKTTELLEINLKYGYGKRKEYAADITQQTEYKRAMTARLAFNYFLDW